MELIVLGVVLLIAVVGVIIVIAWCVDAQQVSAEKNKVLKACKNVFEEYPEYVDISLKYRVFVRKVMREMGVEALTFTFRLND